MIYRLALSILLVARLFCAENGKPNIIFIMCDDMGWKDPTYMGSDLHQTPNMDRIAREGMQFSRAYANCANCAPSRASLMSGMLPPATGVYTVGDSARGSDKLRRLIPVPNNTTLAPSFRSLAESLATAGYRSCHGGKWHLGSGDMTGPEGQGFERNIGGCHAGSPPGGYFAPWRKGVPELDNVDKGTHICDHITGKAIEWLDSTGDDPFFLYLAFYDVHTPLQAKSGLASQYKKLIEQRGKGVHIHDHATYAAMMQTADVNIGRALEWLDSSGKADNTIVVLFSDNGGYGGATRQTPLRGAKGMFYEGGIRVPMAVRWPGHIEAGSSCDVPVQGTDFYPTFCTAAGADMPADLDGVDLMPLLTQQGDIAERDLFWHFPAYLQGPNRFRGDSPDGIFRAIPCSVIMNDNLKLIHYFDDDRMELFDLAKDIGETIDLASSQPETVKAMRQRLDAWRQAHNAPVPSEANPNFNQAAWEEARQDWQLLTTK